MFVAAVLGHMLCERLHQERSCTPAVSRPGLVCSPSMPASRLPSSKFPLAPRSRTACPTNVALMRRRSAVPVRSGRNLPSVHDFAATRFVHAIASRGLCLIRAVATTSANFPRPSMTVWSASMLRGSRARLRPSCLSLQENDGSSGARSCARKFHMFFVSSGPKVGIPCEVSLSIARLSRPFRTIRSALPAAFRGASSSSPALSAMPSWARWAFISVARCISLQSSSATFACGTKGRYSHTSVCLCVSCNVRAPLCPSRRREQESW